MMTGIMIAGRSGSAITAELATMKVSEEIDGLRVMGIDPNRFLVLPRLIAITIVQPALTLMSNFVGIFGGFLIGVFYLDLSPDSYINQTVESLDLGDLFNGLSKSVVFAWIIGTIAAYSGINVRGGREQRRKGDHARSRRQHFRDHRRRQYVRDDHHLDIMSNEDDGTAAPTT